MLFGAVAADCENSVSMDAQVNTRRRVMVESWLWLWLWLWLCVAPSIHCE
jgi:hypothetical protein